MTGKWKKVFLCIFAIGCLLLSACGGGGSDSSNSSSANTLSYEGNNSPLTNLYFDDYGPYGGAYNIDIFLTPTAVDIAQSPPAGRYVYLEMYFPTSTVTPGTYTWAQSEAAGTFSGYSDITLSKDGRISYDNMEGGTVTISQNGSNYIISGNVTTTQGSATFAYNGPLSTN